jgi:hypothetical protein
MTLHIHLIRVRGSQPFCDHVQLNEDNCFGVPPILEFMQLRTTITTFSPQKIQNKQNFCLFKVFCVPPVTCSCTTGGKRTTGWEPLI